MTSPLTVYKLIILYLLDRSGGEIAMEKLSSFLLDRGYAGFLALVRAFAELEESGLTLARTENDLVFLRISAEGEDALRYFGADLGREIRSDCDSWLRANRMSLAQDRAAQGDFVYREDGQYEVRLELRDRQSSLMELSLRVPDKETARRAVDLWRKDNEQIYRFLIENLS